ncbi:hypothetical Protein YC6258_04860 [Gynuella sunshinyii YC6258]|uniref:Uncharacterized protein n=1 Tax=Gynuella sunshinyii YC6258 TaxID=1445510 RepID=A0A0C5VQM1_9GAMM|nr:hypothetical Protein YC6258_04860 [Gynuella sunshinyii YC6258]
MAAIDLRAAFFRNQSQHSDFVIGALTAFIYCALWFYVDGCLSAYCLRDK